MAIQWSFGDLITYFQQIGVYDYFLPFLLVFAIIFATLEKTQLFGQGKERINAVIAFVVGLVLIVQQPIVETINMFLPRVSLLFVIILMGLLIISMIGGKTFQGLQGTVFTVMTIVIIIFVLLALTPNFGFDTGFGLGISQYDLQSLAGIAIPLIIFLVMTFLIMGGSGGKKDSKGFGEGLGKAFSEIEKGFKGGK